MKLKNNTHKIQFFILLLISICLFMFNGCGNGGGIINRPGEMVGPSPNPAVVPTPTPSAGETIGWVYQNPVPTYDHLWGSCKVTEQIAYLAGNRGLIMKTTDGGETWSKLPSQTTRNLFSITFTDQNNGWCAGEEGIILHTTNGGSTWTQQSSPIATHLNSIIFIDANNGWACGPLGKILVTNNGGTTWAEQNSGVATTLYCIKAFNANNAWIVGQNGTILSTVDGGTTWDNRSFGGAPQNALYFYDVYFTGAGTGFMAGERYLYSTNDNWQTKTLLLNNNDQYYYALAFSDATHGFLLGNDTTEVPARGVSYYTDNGFGVIPAANYFGISNQPLNTAYSQANGTAIVATKYGIIDKTTDQGATWTTKSPIFNAGQTQFNGIYFIDTQTGFVVGNNGRIMKTTDEGYNWSIVPSNTALNLNKVWFINSTTGIIVGDDGLILRSTDAGASWAPVTSPVAGDLFGLKFIVHPDGWSYGWACGENGAIIFTKDDGITWTQQGYYINPMYPPVTTTLRNIDCADDFFGFAAAVGDNGALTCTTCYGIDVNHLNEQSLWNTLIRINPPNDLSAVSVKTTPYGVYSSVLYLGGLESIFMKTINWNTLENVNITQYSMKFVDMHFTDYNTGWAIGTGVDADLVPVTFIYYTTDGGTSWTFEYRLMGVYLQDIFAVNSDVAWACGTGGIIIHTTDAGTTNRLIAPFNIKMEDTGKGDQ